MQVNGAFGGDIAQFQGVIQNIENFLGANKAQFKE